MPIIIIIFFIMILCDRGPNLTTTLVFKLLNKLTVYYMQRLTLDKLIIKSTMNGK